MSEVFEHADRALWLGNGYVTIVELDYDYVIVQRDGEPFQRRVRPAELRHLSLLEQMAWAARDG